MLGKRARRLAASRKGRTRNGHTAGSKTETLFRDEKSRSLAPPWPREHANCASPPAIRRLRVARYKRGSSAIRWMSLFGEPSRYTSDTRQSPLVEREQPEVRQDASVRIRKDWYSNSLRSPIVNHTCITNSIVQSAMFIVSGGHDGGSNKKYPVNEGDRRYNYVVH